MVKRQHYWVSLSFLGKKSSFPMQIGFSQGLFACSLALKKMCNKLSVLGGGRWAMTAA